MMLRFMMWLSWVLVQTERMARQAPLVARAVLVPVATAVHLIAAAVVFVWAVGLVLVEMLGSIPARVHSPETANVDAAGVVLRHMRRATADASDDDVLDITLASALEIFSSVSAGMADGIDDALDPPDAPGVSIYWEAPADSENGSAVSGSAWRDDKPVGRVTVSVERRAANRVIAKLVVKVNGRAEPSSTSVICADMREATERAFDLQGQAAQAVADELAAEVAA